MKTLLFALIALGMPAVAEETIITVRGEKYEKASVEVVNPACVKITHEGGVATVRFTDLPTEVQKKYGYDAEKEKAWRAAALAAQLQTTIAAAQKKEEEQAQRQAQFEMQQSGLDATRAAFGDTRNREAFVRALKGER